VRSMASAAKAKEAVPVAAAAAPAPKKESEQTSILDRLGEIYVPPLAGKAFRTVPADFKEFPERDTVNYPYPNKLEFPSKVRLGTIPDSWFRFFYEKTGETGGYVFGLGLATFLLQKEILVIEHHALYRILPNSILLYLGYLFLGRPVGEYFHSIPEEDQQEMYKWKQDQLAEFTNSIQTEEQLQKSYQAINDMLFEAKRENVHLQLEAIYRERLHAIYTAVKRQMDFLSEYEATRRRFQQKHMADWIMQQVRSSITPQIEQAALKQCVLDLKALASAKK